MTTLCNVAIIALAIALYHFIGICIVTKLATDYTERKIKKSRLRMAMVWLVPLFYWLDEDLRKW